MNENLSNHGELSVKLVRSDGAEVQHPILDGLFERLEKDVDGAIKGVSEVFITSLEAHHYDADGNLKGHHTLGSGLVTTAGVNLLAADWTNTTATLKLANFHDSGTGATAAAIGDTAMQTPTGNARGTGTQSNPSAGQYRTVATLAYTGTAAITEWGLFSVITAGTMIDHKVFAAINVVNGDSIQYTYTLTCVAGG